MEYLLLRRLLAGRLSGDSYPFALLRQQFIGMEWQLRDCQGVNAWHGVARNSEKHKDSETEGQRPFEPLPPDKIVVGLATRSTVRVTYTGRQDPPSCRRAGIVDHPMARRLSSGKAGVVRPPGGAASISAELSPTGPGQVFTNYAFFLLRRRGIRRAAIQRIRSVICLRVPTLPFFPISSPVIRRFFTIHQSLIVTMNLSAKSRRKQFVLRTDSIVATSNISIYRQVSNSRLFRCPEVPPSSSTAQAVCGFQEDESFDRFIAPLSLAPVVW